jgi:hypothetical protein
MKPEKIIQYCFGGLVVLGLFVVMGLLLWKPIPPENKSTFEIIAGALTGSVITVIAYYFGSSKGSADKSEMMIK